MIHSKVLKIKLERFVKRLVITVDPAVKIILSFIFS